MHKEAEKYYLFKVLLLILTVTPLSGQNDYSVIEYYPAPGQFINVEDIGTPSAASNLGNSSLASVCLGSFGGFLTIKFDNSIINDIENPYGIDFVVLGNATSEFSEPSIVMVMEDSNGNGQPDDTWYELAGSNHFYANSIDNYTITYFKSDNNGDILWKDNFGQLGLIPRNSYHNQDYYPGEDFDSGFYGDSCVFSGTMIFSQADRSDPYRIRSWPKRFGYADNKPVLDRESLLPDNPYTEEIEGMGGDSFDISWAIDADGNYIELSKIDFLKIYTCSMADLSPLGELSSEILDIVDIMPASEVNGKDTLFFIEELSDTLDPGVYQLFAHYFINGKRIEPETINWSINKGSGFVSEEGLLTASQASDLIIHAQTDGQEAFLSIKISELSSDSNIVDTEDVLIYPVPFQDNLTISAADLFKIEILDIQGRVVYNSETVNDKNSLSLSNLRNGIYLVHLHFKDYSLIKKIIKSN